MTTAQHYWMMSIALTTTTSLSYSVPILQSLIVDVVLTIMMLLCSAVSLTIHLIH